MQIVADILQAPVQRLTGHSGSCLGAAWTAALGTGQASDWSGINAFVRYGEMVEPDPDQAEAYNTGYRRFHHIYESLRSDYRDRPLTSG